MTDLDRLRHLSGLLARDVTHHEDYRVGSPLVTISTALDVGTAYEPIEDWLPKVYAGWVQRFGKETTDAVIDGLHRGTLTFDPSRVRWGKDWSPRPMDGLTYG